MSLTASTLYRAEFVHLFCSVLCKNSVRFSVYALEAHVVLREPYVPIAFKPRKIPGTPLCFSLSQPHDHKVAVGFRAIEKS
jgi:hypothetical protein